jgi:hypothetical protein
MSTLTALKQRPFIVSTSVVELELVQATAEDLKEFHKYGPGGLKIMQLRIGMVYFLKSSLTGKIEPIPYKLDEHTDQHDIKAWLDFGMIYIIRCWK